MAGPLMPNPAPPSVMAVGTLEHWEKRVQKSPFFLNGLALLLFFAASLRDICFYFIQLKHNIFNFLNYTLLTTTECSNYIPLWILYMRLSQVYQVELAQKIHLSVHLCWLRGGGWNSFTWNNCRLKCIHTILKRKNIERYLYSNKKIADNIIPS